MVCCTAYAIGVRLMLNGNFRNSLTKFEMHSRYAFACAMRNCIKFNFFFIDFLCHGHIDCHGSNWADHKIKRHNISFSWWCDDRPPNQFIILIATDFIIAVLAKTVDSGSPLPWWEEGPRARFSCQLARLFSARRTPFLNVFNLHRMKE